MEKSDAAKIHFFLFNLSRLFQLFLYRLATQSERLVCFVLVAHLLDAVAHLSVRAVEHLAQVVERHTVLVVQDVIGKVTCGRQMPAVAFCKQVLELVAELRRDCLCDSHYLGFLPPFT